MDLTTLVKAHNTKVPKIVDQCVNEVEKRGNLFLRLFPILYKYCIHSSLILYLNAVLEF